MYVLLHIDVDGGMSLRDAHEVGERVRDRVLRTLPQVVQIDVHMDPFPDHDAHWPFGAY